MQFLKLTVLGLALALAAACDTMTYSPAKPAAATAGVIRIKAGRDTPFKDSAGNVWAPDAGFDAGELADRDPALAIANTKDPDLYRSEHWGMRTFKQKLPNGHYLVKLYFAETYDGIDGPGGRVFTMNVEGKEFKDFDVWVKAKDHYAAYIETVPVDIKDGSLDITFEPSTQECEINAIEIIPAK